MVNFQFIFRLLTIRTSSYFFADLPPRQSVPILHCCMELFHPSCRTFPSFLFHFMRLLLSVACLGISEWQPCPPMHQPLSKLLSSTILLGMYSIPLSKLLIKMLTVSSQVSVPKEHYLDFELLTTTFFFPPTGSSKYSTLILLHMVSIYCC